MIRRISSLTILSLVLVAFLAMTAFSARTAKEARVINPVVNSSLQYSFPDAHIQIEPASGKEMPRQALGDAGYQNPQGVGINLGNTWYDYQRNGSMRRMIASQYDGSDFRIHFIWMRLAQASFTARHYYYKTYSTTSGAFDCEKSIQPSDQYAGYTVVEATGDNRGIAGGHNNTAPGTGVYQSHFYFDFGPGSCNFLANCRVPDALSQTGQYTTGSGEDGYIWPAMCWQEGSTETVLHVFAQEANPDAGTPQAIAYFRTTDPEAACNWTVRVVDTVQDISQDCDCTDDGKVVLAWIANRPDPNDATCVHDTNSVYGDTCSSIGYVKYGQWDNDVYWQISNDGGLTWQPRVNVTMNIDSVEGYRPYTDLSVLITSDNNVHVVWAASYWPADANYGGDAGFYRGRILHASENIVDGNGRPIIRTAHSADWDQTTCSPPAWNLNASKMTLSECDGRLYVLFVQFNDIPAGREDDCATEDNPGFPGGAANGDLYLVVSEDGGITWDQARNLTNTYTPGCDSVGGSGGACASENWPSMVKFGSNYTGTYPSGIIVVPDGCTDPENYYLDVQYIDDPSAGGIVQNEGYWQSANVNWFRIPCCPAIPNPQLSYNPTSIGYPSWTKHGVQKDVTVNMENSGNADLNISSTTTYETSGTSGWLSISGFPTTIPAGLNNTASGTIHINTGGLVNNPGTVEYLAGGIVFVSDAPSSPDTLPIECWVADTLYPVIWDTVNTSCTKLTVATNGNFGNQGKGGVNMDYYNPPADSDNVYLYDGSPIITWDDGTLHANWSMFSTSYTDENGFVPLGDHTPTTDMGDYEVFESGKFVTHDSTIAVEKIWYAPKAGTDTCSFVIECIKVYMNKNVTVSGVKVGEAIDFDIPADTGSRNGSGFDNTLNLMYQVGCEEDGATPDYSRYYGGIFYLDCYQNGTRCDDLSNIAPYGAYTHDNFTHVYPEGDFVPETLYTYMSNSGYAVSDSTCTDLHTVMTFENDLTITPSDTFVFYVGIATHKDGTLNDFTDEVKAAKAWYCGHIAPEECGCCQNRGDADGSGAVNVADLTYMVNYLFKGGPAPVCPEEGDADGSGATNVADLTYLVNYLFKGGPPPPPC